MGTQEGEPDYVSRSILPAPHKELMRRQREDRAGREHESVEVDRDLIGIEDRDEHDGRETASERGAEQLERKRSTRAGTFMAFGEMAVTTRTSRQ